MKNVTKILTAAVLCAALFASTQRTNALGGNAAFWPGDEANIAAFPAQLNNHAHAQFSGVGGTATTTDLLFNHNGTTWGFGFEEGDADTWFDLSWAKNGMGLNVTMISSDDGSGTEASGNTLSYGNSFDWGELGVHYASGDGVGTEGITANYRKACGFWVFTDMVASVSMPDDTATNGMGLSADWFTHWDASGADVMFAMGLDYADSNDAGANGHVSQTAAVGVEANLTDWATFRAGYNWSWQLSGDSDEVGGTDAGGENWAMGLGFNWGGFNVDFDMGDGFFGDPMGHFSGFATPDSDTFGSCTLTYNF